MTERRAHFSQRDLARAMRAAKAAGMEDKYEFKLAGGELRIIPRDANGAAGADDANPWDQVLNDGSDKKRAS